MVQNDADEYLDTQALNHANNDTRVSDRNVKASRYQGYLAFLKNESRYEPIHKLEWLVINVCYGWFFTYAAFRMHAHLGLEQFVKWTLMMFVCEHVWFGIIHVLTHSWMLVTYRLGDENNIPYAHYHHYMDSGLYGKRPYSYRMHHGHNMFFMFFGLWTLAIGSHPVDAYVLLAITMVDNFTHEWYHTKNYNSLNPFSSKFIGINMFYTTLQMIGFCNLEEHYREHHKQKTVRTQHLTEAWVDFGLPGFKYILNPMLDALWYVTKKWMKWTSLSHVAQREVLRWSIIIVDFVCIWATVVLRKTIFPEVDQFSIMDIRVSFTVFMFIIFQVNGATIEYRFPKNRTGCLYNFLKIFFGPETTLEKKPKVETQNILD